MHRGHRIALGLLLSSLVGCGLDVELSTIPNPAVVGKPAVIKVTVANDEEGCIIDEVQLCLFPFAKLTPAQAEFASGLQAARDAGTLLQFALAAEIPEGFPYDMSVAMPARGEVRLPAENGDLCSLPVEEDDPVCCALGTLNSGESAELLFTVLPLMEGAFENFAIAMGTGRDGSACSSTTPFSADLEEIFVGDGTVPAPLLSGFGLATLIAMFCITAGHSLRRTG